jgi:hypothetical protein
MEACAQDSCKKYKDSDGEKEKEVCISSLDDALNNLSCNIKFQLIEKKQNFFGAVARATLNTFTTWGTCKLVDTLNGVLPQWAII